MAGELKPVKRAGDDQVPFDQHPGRGTGTRRGERGHSVHRHEREPGREPVSVLCVDEHVADEQRGRSHDTKCASMRHDPALSPNPEPRIPSLWPASRMAGEAPMSPSSIVQKNEARTRLRWITFRPFRGGMPSPHVARWDYNL